MTTSQDAGATATETRRSSRRAVACGAVLLPLLLVVGCAGSGPKGADSNQAVSGASKGLDGRFAARFERACAPYVQYNSKHYFNAKGFNRFDPDADLLPRVAASMDRNPAYRTLVSDLEALGRPKTGEAAWSTVLSDVRNGQELAKNEIHTARKVDVAAFTKADERVTKNLEDLSTHLGGLGLQGGSACYGVLRDPLQTKPRSE